MPTLATLARITQRARDVFNPLRWVFKFGSRKKIFEVIYEKDLWNDEEGESVSGPGSSVEITGMARAAIEQVIADRGIRSMLDAPCGDFNWMRHTALGSVAYTGADIVVPMIARNNERYASETRKFIVLDLVDGSVPAADLVFCRDCIMHLKTPDVQRLLRNISGSGSRYLLITNHPGAGENQELRSTGNFRPINLSLPPYNLKPLAEYPDRDPKDMAKTLALIQLPI